MGKGTFKTGSDYQTIWMKLKTKKVFKGDNKGDEYEILQGTVDMGGGKMLTLELYADLNLRDVKGEEMLPLKARKWKSDRNSNSNKGSRKKTW